MAREDRRKKKTCIVCGERISPETVPWSMIGFTGDMVFWHSACDKENHRG